MLSPANLQAFADIRRAMIEDAEQIPLPHPFKSIVTNKKILICNNATQISYKVKLSAYAETRRVISTLYPDGWTFSEKHKENLYAIIPFNDYYTDILIIDRATRRQVEITSRHAEHIVDTLKVICDFFTTPAMIEERELAREVKLITGYMTLTEDPYLDALAYKVFDRNNNCYGWLRKSDFDLDVWTCDDLDSIPSKRKFPSLTCTSLESAITYIEKAMMKSQKKKVENDDVDGLKM